MSTLTISETLEVGALRQQLAMYRHSIVARSRRGQRLALRLRCFQGRRHLPVVELSTAA